MIDQASIDAVLFDLDGTLMDTDDQAVETLAKLLKRLRIRQPLQTARSLILASEPPGNALITLVDMVGLDTTLIRFTDRLRRWRGLRTQANYRLIAGAEDMLAHLRQRYRLGIVTTRSLREARAFLTQYDLQDAFEVVVTRESTWRLKPHPSPIRLAAQLMGVPIERCAMVGDTTVDMKSARRAGAIAVGVLCGFGDRASLEQAGANIILEHTSEIVSLLT
ncbi:MAG: HAD family hydrolase [Chloroflexi bacterium]|nr:HAD family hydrolase [Chloroflexota bacterium]